MVTTDRNNVTVHLNKFQLKSALSRQRYSTPKSMGRSLIMDMDS